MVGRLRRARERERWVEVLYLGRMLIHGLNKGQITEEYLNVAHRNKEEADVWILPMGVCCPKYITGSSGVCAVLRGGVQASWRQGTLTEKSVSTYSLPWLP